MAYSVKSISTVVVTIAFVVLASGGTLYFKTRADAMVGTGHVDATREKVVVNAYELDIVDDECTCLAWPWSS